MRTRHPCRMGAMALAATMALAVGVAGSDPLQQPSDPSAGAPIPADASPPAAPLIPAPPQLREPPSPPSANAIGAAFRAGPMPQNSRSKRIERHVEARGRGVSLSSSASNVEVVPSSDGRVSLVVDLEYWSNSDEWMQAVDQEFDVAVRETASEIEIEPSAMPDLGRRSWLRRLFEGREVSYELEISLAVPAGTALTVDNRYGDIVVERIGGAARLTNASGATRLAGARGEVQIDNRYGDVRASNVDGTLEVTMTSGALWVEQVTGDVDLSNRYGDVTVVGVGGSLRLDGSSGAVDVRGVDGDTTVINSYGDVAARTIMGRAQIEVNSGSVVVADVEEDLDLQISYGDLQVRGVAGDLVLRGASSGGTIGSIGGSARVDTSYSDLSIEDVVGPATISNVSGAVTATNVGGDTSITCSYATVRATGVRGSLSVSGTSTAVFGRDIDGPADIRTSYDGVTLEEVRGAVTVRNQSGRVAVSGLSGAALTAQHRIETTYADIVFVWPAAAPPARFHLQSSYGRIASDFAGTSEERGSRRISEGQTGDGDPVGSIDLTAQSGNITFRRR